MFLAPCTLPIVPGYLAFIAGVPLSALQNPAARKSARRAVLKNALAFCLGFSVVFILLGASAGLLGALLGPWREILARLGGGIIIIFGLTMLGVLNTSFLSRERRLRLPEFLTLGRLSSSALVGALFALGWSPCIGPILGTVLLIASTSSTALYGAGLLGVFSLGLAIPFLITAALVSETSLFLARAAGFVRWLSLIGGLSLVLGGILMLTGSMAHITNWGYQLFEFFGYDRLYNFL